MTLLSILLASLLGSLHCAAMCGGFVVAASDGHRSLSLSMIAYNVGRLTTYLALGVVAGVLGGSIDALGAKLGIPNIAALLLGLLLIAYGAFRLVSGERPLPGFSGVHRWMTKVYQGIAQRLPRDSSALRGYAIGLLSTLLPCGWLYGFAGVAGASADPLRGALVMVVFWLGTLPMMLSLGAFARTVLQRWGAQIPAISSALLIAAGFFSIASHLGLVGDHSAHHSGHHHDHQMMSEDSQSSSAVSDAADSEMPEHHHHH